VGGARKKNHRKIQKQVPLGPHHKNDGSKGSGGDSTLRGQLGKDLSQQKKKKHRADVKEERGAGGFSGQKTNLNMTMPWGKRGKGADSPVIERVHTLGTR